MSGERKLRVLVVDDNSGVCEVVADTVRYAGHEVVGTAGDGVEAVARAHELRPDLVLMDVMMPRKNGAEALREIKQAGTARHVVMMSAEWRSAGVTPEQLIQRGATAFLEKPFDVDKLFAVLAEIARSPAD